MKRLLGQHLTYSAPAGVQGGPPIDDPRWREPAVDMAQMPTARMGPPPRSFAADAHDCIMVRIRTDLPHTSLWRRCTQWRAPLGSLCRHSTGAVRRRSFQERPHLAVHPPSACSGVKALRNTSDAKAASRQAPLAFRSLDAFRALRAPDRRRRDEERPFRSEQRTVCKNPKNNQRIDSPAPGKAP